MKAQEQAKILQNALVSQQSVVKVPDAEQVPDDGAATGIEDVLLATLDILQDTSGCRDAVLSPPLDMGDPCSYITGVREPCPMPNVGRRG